MIQVDSKFKRNKIFESELEELFNKKGDDLSPFEGLGAKDFLTKLLINLPEEDPHTFDVYLLLINWYERYYREEIIFSMGIIDNIFPEVRIRKKELHDEVRERMLNYFDSKKYEGYSIVHEYYTDRLPNLEKFSFQEFKGIDLAKYLFELFPQIKYINHDNGFVHKYEFLKVEEEWEFDDLYGMGYFEYEHTVPQYRPYTLTDNENWRKLLPVTSKEIENFVREEKELPRIGEGWISETLLFRKIKSHFKNLEVLHHGKPDWLGLQHFDIWIPEIKVAIEYQGKQHDEAVEYFGGKEAFELNQQRDLKKKQKCVENNCYLIEIRPNYKLGEVINEINSRIK